MYKVLLVDDERTILDGISMLINWSQHNVQLIGKAMNGVEAFQLIEEETPDIVITDIRMPGLDGIGLVEKAVEKYPHIKWIFLSGYSDFKYAQQAMRFGVRHYLLKPCNESQISDSLVQVVSEIDEELKANEYLQNIQDEALKIYDYEHQEIMKKYFSYQALPGELQDQIKSVLKERFGNQMINLIVFQPLSKLNYSCLEKILSVYLSDASKTTSLGIIIEDSVIILEGEPESRNHLSERFTALQHANIDSFVISSEFDVERFMQEKITIQDFKNQTFYYDESQIISTNNWIDFETEICTRNLVDVDKLALSVKKGELKQANSMIELFANYLKEDKIDPHLTKGYFIQVYLLLMTRNNSNLDENKIEIINRLESFQHLHQYRSFFHDLFQSIMDNKQKEVQFSKVVRDMLDCIDQEIENPELTIQWLGQERIYMNPDYLGKLFKKEVGQRFSSYLTNARINKAVEIIENEENIKVFELAERLGFGSNPQYFSQLFKKIKGYTPSKVLR
ncbi:response regulator [Gracilibacillus salinarum]|uniref:Response regulator n=1 Tax=Gracilibacillus salinarum TaxID=2932255 RepID=A0ABY4GLZ9_9BACI|nr:response regulator [Gracilibacillus salinarum]UOQ85264.1 response regulator [Gracilibacillus salinarum]